MDAYSTIMDAYSTLDAKPAIFVLLYTINSKFVVLRHVLPSEANSPLSTLWTPVVQAGTPDVPSVLHQQFLFSYILSMPNCWCLVDVYPRRPIVLCRPYGRL